MKFDRSQLPPAPDFSFEAALWSAGVCQVGGIDEAGRGALAGPVTAAVVIFPAQRSLQADLQGVRDSKQMTANRREYWAERLLEYALDWGVGYAEAGEIDQIGIVAAVHLAASRALGKLRVVPEHLLIDVHAYAAEGTPLTALVKGDARCLSIAAASILAKTSRDARMRRLEATYPGYGFARHKGYGTLAHRQAIEQYGLSPQHRRSFKLKHL
jgi:ribonuclease HII